MEQKSDGWDWLGVGPDDMDGLLREDRWSVDVDWADESLGPVVVGQVIEPPDMAEGLALTVVAAHGPGGGWPIVRATGPYFRVMAFLAEYHDDPTIAHLVVEELEGRETEALEPDDAALIGAQPGASWSSLTPEQRSALRRHRGYVGEIVESDYDDVDSAEDAKVALRRQAYEVHD